MNVHRVVRGLQIACFAIAFLIVFTFAVHALWNWLMPPLFGWHVITIWQALGVLILSKILFGGFRGGARGGWPSRRRIIERWEKMTPEEREKFRQSMRGRCGPFGDSAAEPKV
jgi:hypothetical protein